MRSMQTAAWACKEFGINDIVINYQICENITTTDPGADPLDWHFDENPMPHLEYVKSGSNFKKMLEDSPEYKTQ